MHDGGTKEGAERLFGNIGQEFETGMRGSISQVDQLFPLTHQTDDALLVGQSDLADRGRG